MSEPLVTGVTAAVVGASDLQPHLDLWCGVFGYEVVASGTVEARTAAALYRLDDAVEVRVLAAPGTDSGMLHLLHLPGATPLATPPQMVRTGLQGLDLYARSLADAGSALAAAGRSWRVPGQSYDVPLGERTVTVTEASLLGPDDTQVVLVEPSTPRGTQAWASGASAPFTELTSVVVTVVDVDRELAFWAGLGMEQLYDVTFQHEALERVAGLPAGTDVRISFMVGPTTARVEVFGLPNGPIEAAPPLVIGGSLGHSGWSVRTRDLQAALSALGEVDITTDLDVVEVTTPQHGSARLARVRTPGGVAVELWEPSR